MVAVYNLQRATELAEAEGVAQVEERHLLTAILEDDPESFTLRSGRQPGRGMWLRWAVWWGCGGHADSGSGSAPYRRPWPAKAKLDPLIGRHAQVRQLVRTLARKKKNNPVPWSASWASARQPSSRGWQH